MKLANVVISKTQTKLVPWEEHVQKKREHVLSAVGEEKRPVLYRTLLQEVFENEEWLASQDIENIAIIDNLFSVSHKDHWYHHFMDQLDTASCSRLFLVGNAPYTTGGPMLPNTTSFHEGLGEALSGAEAWLSLHPEEEVLVVCCDIPQLPTLSPDTTIYSYVRQVKEYMRRGAAYTGLYFVGNNAPETGIILDGIKQAAFSFSPEEPYNPRANIPMIKAGYSTKARFNAAAFSGSLDEIVELANIFNISLNVLSPTLDQIKQYGNVGPSLLALTLKPLLESNPEDVFPAIFTVDENTVTMLWKTLVENSSPD